MNFNSDFFKGLLEILYVIGGFIAGKIFTWVANKIRTRLKFSIKKSHEVRTRLGEMRAALRADRAMILQFHNGKEFVGEGKLHSYYLSCTFESTEMGFSSEIQNLQGLPISAWSEILLRITDDKENGRKFFLIGTDTNICEWSWEETKLSTYPTRWNISGMAVCKLKSSKDQFRGIVVFGFDDTDSMKDLVVMNSELRNQLEVFLEDLRSQL